MIGSDTSTGSVGKDVAEMLKKEKIIIKAVLRII